MMIIITISFLSFLLLGISKGQTFTCEINSTDSSFDYFMFVQENSVAFCHFYSCLGGTTDKLWTLHGLWPTKQDKPVPAYCGGQFNMTSLQAILGELSQDWPGLHDSSIQFWKHEWCRHGTCATSVESLNTELKFFTAVLNLYKEYNIETILQKSGVTPAPNGTPYKMIDYNNAFLQAYGVTPFLQCQYNDDTGFQELVEIFICFNKDLTPVSCDNSLYTAEPYACSPDDNIYYFSQS